VSNPKKNHTDLMQELSDSPFPPALEPLEGLLAALREGVEVCPFNTLIGLKVKHLTLDDMCVRIEMRDDLIGNEIKGMLHGGAISTVLDVTGSIVATTGIMKEMQDRPLEEIIQRSLKVGTIDLRVDYLKPGKGKYFQATGTPMHMGSGVCIARTELRNDQAELIAVATGTYKVG